MDANIEDIEEKRNAKMRALLTASLISLFSIVMTILFYFLELELNRQLTIYIALLGGVIIIIGFAIPRRHLAVGLAVSMSGFCVEMIVISFVEGQFIPAVFGLSMVFTIMFGVYYMMKTRYVEKLEQGMLDNLKGSWEIDERGYVRKIDYPIGAPLLGEIKNNIYGLWARSWDPKDKIEHISIFIFKVRNRNPEHEKKLLPHIRSVMEMEFDNETVEKNGGMDKILEGIEWEQVWGN